VAQRVLAGESQAGRVDVGGPEACQRALLFYGNGDNSAAGAQIAYPQRPILRDFAQGELDQQLGFGPGYQRRRCCRILHRKKFAPAQQVGYGSRQQALLHQRLEALPAGFGERLLRPGVKVTARFIEAVGE
jgi:hypothetical protein